MRKPGQDRTNYGAGHEGRDSTKVKKQVKDTLRRVAKLLSIVIVAIIAALLSEAYHGRAACVAAELVNGERCQIIRGEIVLADVRASIQGAIEKTLAEKSEPEIKISADDVELLANVIYFENWNTDPEKKTAYWTGAVVLNRVKSERWPSTIREVLYQSNPRQYSTTGKFFTKEIPAECYDMARDLIENGAPDVPETVVFQSRRKQGSGVWQVINGEYFCYE